MNGKIKNAFSEIHADERLKRETMEKLTARKKRMPLRYLAAPVLVVLALLITGHLYLTPVSYISIDINPSIELAVNTFDRVIGVTASNADGEKVLEGVSLLNLKYAKAMERLESAAGFAPYRNRYTEVTVIADSETDSEKIIETIHACSFGGENVACYSGSQEDQETAKAYGISFGKYRAYLELKSVDPEITVEEIRDLPMKTIREMITHCGEDDQDEEHHDGEEDTSHQGNGSGEDTTSHQGDGSDVEETPHRGNGNGEGHHGQRDGAAESADSSE